MTGVLERLRGRSRRARGQVIVMFVRSARPALRRAGARHRRRQLLERLHSHPARRRGRGPGGCAVHAGRLRNGLVDGDRRSLEERLLDDDRCHGHARDQRRVRPADRRDDLLEREHLLPRHPRGAHRPDHADGDRRVHAAGADGQPAQQLRRQLGQVLDGHRGAGLRSRQRRRLRVVLQPEPDPEHPVRRQRLQLRDRRAGRGRVDERRPLRRDVLCRRPDEGHRRPMAPVQPIGVAVRVDVLHALVGSRRDPARLQRRRGRRGHGHAVRARAAIGSERRLSRDVGELSQQRVLLADRLHLEHLPQRLVDSRER